MGEGREREGWWPFVLDFRCSLPSLPPSFPSLLPPFATIPICILPPRSISPYELWWRFSIVFQMPIYCSGMFTDFGIFLTRKSAFGFTTKCLLHFVWLKLLFPRFFGRRREGLCCFVPFPLVNGVCSSPCRW